MRNFAKRICVLLMTGILMTAFLPARALANTVVIGKTMTADIGLVVIGEDGKISRAAAEPISEETLNEGEYLSLCVEFQNTGDTDVSLEGYSLMIDDQEAHVWEAGSVAPAGGSSATYFGTARMSSYGPGEHTYWLYKSGECDSVGSFTIPETIAALSYVSGGLFSLSPKEFCIRLNQFLSYFTQDGEAYTAELGTGSDGTPVCLIYCGSEAVGSAFMQDSNLHSVSESSSSFYCVAASVYDAEKINTHLSIILFSVQLALDPKMELDDAGAENITALLTAAVTYGEGNLNGIRFTLDSEEYIVRWYAQ